MSVSPAEPSTANRPDAPARITDPHDLVREKDVAKTLLSDKGSSAKLSYFTVKDFTKKGDNYACVVSSVVVDYVVDGKNYKTSYVVKLNPCRGENFDTFSKVLFEKEIGFYTQVLPMINAELVRVNERPLRVPRCFHCVQEPFKEVMYLEDLRIDGYRMFDRKNSLDKAHTNMILKEQARLHAASVLLMSRGEFQGINIKEKLPVLLEAFEEIKKDNTNKTFDQFMPKILENTANIIERSEGYKKVAESIRSMTENVTDIFDKQLLVTDQFSVICHGDCWINNLMFRYSEKGEVEECRLLDLQMCRVGSPALDLNYMLYSNLSSEVRKPELPSFLINYYASFASVMAAGGVVMKFTLTQLMKEFYEKNLFGLIMALMVIPLILAESEDAPNMEEMLGEDMDKSMKDFQEQMSTAIQKNPLTKTRLLSMLDEMVDSGALC